MSQRDAAMILFTALHNAISELAAGLGIDFGGCVGPSLDLPVQELVRVVKLLNGGDFTRPPQTVLAP